MDIDELKNYVTSNKRICPIPLVWNKFVDIFKIGNVMTPNLIPLILNGWTASDLEKRKRLLKQIDYASKDVVMFEELSKFILNLKEDEWHYGNEPQSDDETPLI